MQCFCLLNRLYTNWRQTQPRNMYYYGMDACRYYLLTIDNPFSATYLLTFGFYFITYHTTRTTSSKTHNCFRIAWELHPWFCSGEFIILEKACYVRILVPDYKYVSMRLRNKGEKEININKTKQNKNNNVAQQTNTITYRKQCGR